MNQFPKCLFDFFSFLSRFGYLLFGMICSLGRILQATINNKPVTHRQFVSFPSALCLHQTFKGKDVLVNQQGMMQMMGRLRYGLHNNWSFIPMFWTFVAAPDVNIDLLAAIFNESYFVLPSMLPLWKLALALFQERRWDILNSPYSLHLIQLIGYIGNPFYYFEDMVRVVWLFYLNLSMGWGECLLHWITAQTEF